jgi:hypothetical protein
MPLQQTSGAASYDAFGGGVAAVPKYIEEYFSTFLYTGNNTSQTITNGIDLATKGGLVWIKSRAGTYVREHYLYDTARGTILSLSTDTTGGNVNNSPNGVSAYNTTGFDIVGSLGSGGNGTGTTYTSWTLAKAPKFFDVVTYSGSSSTQNIAHNLGSVPGCIIVKRTSGVEDWFVYHTSLGNTQYLKLNGTGAAASGFAAWNNTSPTSTQFTVLGGRTEVNAAGSDYVAYLFAHDAGGFGLTGTDNVISCGSYTGSATDWAAGATLGYEPQWVLIKNITSGTANWNIFDNMRGMFVSSADDPVLFPNLSNAEEAYNLIRPTATGFEVANSSRVGGAGNTCIYIAIRRGPMKVPTSGTSVFAPIYSNPGTTNTPQTTGFPVDLQINRYTGAADDNYVVDRLRGVNTTATNNATPYLLTNSTAAEGSSISTSRQWTNTTFGSLSAIHIYWNFGRAPSFFDEVCYTGTGAQQNISHNLGAVPQLIFVKSRSAANGGLVYNATITASKYLKLFFTGEGDRAVSNDTGGFAGVEPTSSVFTVGTYNNVNGSGSTYVAYLFATCAGVSKVGSYTGTGTTKQIDCGFTAGARFVLIKRTDSTGDWYVWDTARGIVSGNDSYLLLNSTAAEVTNTDYIDTYSAGFEISSTAPAAINASGGSFIFFAVA